MGIADGEIDFPRGGALPEDKEIPKAAPVASKRKADEPLFGDGTRPDKSQKKSKKAKKVKEVDPNSGIWTKKITLDVFTDGVMGCGIVTEIHDDIIQLETVNGCKVDLPVTQICKQFTELVKADKISAEDVFTIGQFVPFRVIKKSIDNGKGKRRNPPIVSCDPAKLNSHLTPARLVPGLVIHSVVESLEEKGAVLNIGLQSMKGFLPQTKYPTKGLVVGKPLVVRAESHTSRVLTVTSFVEQDNLSFEACEKLQLNHLMPGTIIDAEPEEATSEAGIFVNLGNGVRGYIAKLHLPPRLRVDMHRIGRAIRVVVMMCQQNSNILVLSAHPDIVAISKPEKRASFQGLEIGDKIKCRVVTIVPNKHTVYFSLPDGEDGKTPLVSAVCSKGFLENSENIESTYKLGSQHLCRIVGYRYVERVLLVSTKKDVLKQKYVSYKDAIPGELVTAKVLRQLPKGVSVLIYDMIRGYLPISEASDKAVSLEKSFPEGRVFSCRVLLIDSNRKNVVVTARQSLIESKYPVINSYDEVFVGKVSTGIIVKIFDTSAVLVRFYNGVTGMVQAKDAKHFVGSLKLGKPTNVQVVSVDTENERINLVFSDDSMKSSIVQKPEATKIVAPGSGIYDATLEEVVVSTISGKKSESLHLHVAAGNSSFEATLIPSHMSDRLDIPCEQFKNFVQPNQNIGKVSPLGALPTGNRVTSKRFISSWLTNPVNLVPKKFEDLTVGALLCGIISQRKESQIFMEIAGGSGLVGRISSGPFAKSFQVGQTIVGKVSHLDEEKRHFTVDCNPCHCYPANRESIAIDLIKSFVEEDIWLAKTASLPDIGSVVTATVSQIFDDFLFVTFSGKRTGVVRQGNFIEGTKVSDKIRCVVMNYSYPQMDAELVQIVEKPKKKKHKEVAEPSARIVLVKRDFLIALRADNSLCFVPNRLHPNDIPECNSDTRHLVGEAVTFELISASEENIFIGLIEGDTKKIQDIIDGDKKTFPPSKKNANSLTEGGDDALSHIDEENQKNGIRAKSIKNFAVYTGQVLGMWTSHDDNIIQQESSLCAKIKLPGDSLGRLHISELPNAYSNLAPDVNPIKKFVKDHLMRQVNVKVIGIAALKKGSSAERKKIRIAEITMKEEKIMETRLRAKRLAYRRKFKAGDVVDCYAPETKSADGKIRMEINPMVQAVVPREFLPDDLLLNNECHEDSVVEVSLNPGERRKAVVKDVTKVRYHHERVSLVLSLLSEKESKQLEEKEIANKTKAKSIDAKFTPGFKITGRVVGVTDLTVRLLLGDGHQAFLTPTAIASKYERVSEFAGRFNKDEVFRLYAVRMDLNPKRYYVATESRYGAYEKNKNLDGDHNPSALLLSTDDVRKIIGKPVLGFVIKQLPKSTVVEIGPGLNAVMSSVKESELVDLPVGSVVEMVVLNVSKKNQIALKFKETRYRPNVPVVKTSRIARKRTTSMTEAEEILKKTSEAEATSDAGVKVTVSDPGFDWSNAGFLPEDLAAVGKLGTDDHGEPMEDDKPLDQKKEEKSNKKTKKSLSKEEVDIQKEKTLIARENAIADEAEPQNDEEFAMLLRKNPNSSEVWIRYMTFFLTKNDLTKARATAERALEAINFREADELFNVWTAYLNLEVAYGDEQTTKAVFQRAYGNVDSLKIHKQMAAIFVANKKHEEANAVFKTMIHKFRSSSDDVWYLYAEYMMANDRLEESRELLQRALKSVPKMRHTGLISRFAQLEYRLGDAERGKTLFEGIVSAYPKKTDVWMVYADFALKYTDTESARRILERACALPLNMHKLRPLFKKWMEFEEKHGDEQSQQLVRSQAERFLQAQTQEE